MAAPPPSASEPLPPALIARFEAGVAAALARVARAQITHAVTPDLIRGSFALASAGEKQEEAGPRLEAGFPEVNRLSRASHAHPLAIAVSGGSDSMALLAIAHAARPGCVVAATFDHGLRPASAGEAAMVADWSAAQGIRHTTLRPDRPLPTANIQAAARDARYAALAEWAAGEGAALLATAHHADDQAETFLMRANRGSGPAGLAGIRRARALEHGVTLIRPLLDWRRAELAAIASALPTVDDPSNVNPHYTRVRARGWLAAVPEIDPAQLARAAEHAADVAADLDELAEWAWSVRQIDDGAGIDIVDLPRALRRVLIRRAIAAVRSAHAITESAFDAASNVEPLLNALEAGRRATQAGVMVTPQGASWRLAPAPPRRTG